MDFNLFAPPFSQTEASIALLWDKPAVDVDKYQILLNGKKIAETFNTDYTLTDLTPDTDYEISVCAYKSDTVVLKSNTITAKTAEVKPVFNIADFGAVGDGVTMNTDYIQNAINACTEGGKVYVPKGVYKTGALFLKSDITLYLEKDSVLLGSENINDYPVMTYRFEGLETQCYASLINTGHDTGERFKNIAIIGDGKIDASGSRLIKPELEENKGKRGRAVCIRNADNVYLNGITVKHSPAWCLHLIYCNDITVNNVKIYTRADENGNRYEHIFNGDGLDPDSCKNVYIFNCDIASQDDCIAIKSGKDEEGRKIGISSENIRITNCRFKSGFGIVVGSEMSGGVRNVLVQDCCFNNTFSIASIKAPRGRGNVIENIVYDNCTLKNTDTEYSDCRWFRGGLYIDKFYSIPTAELSIDEKQEVNEGTPVFRNITLKNISLETVGGNAIYLAGLAESPLENITLENVTAVGKYGFKAYNINGLKLRNVNVKSMEDENYISKNVTEIKE